jgi:hypothetical protein
VPSTNSPQRHASPPRIRSLSSSVPIKTIQGQNNT